MSSDQIPTEIDLDQRAARHLRYRLGVWPPESGLQIVASELRDEPEWDGVVRPVLGVETPEGVLISVSPAAFAEVERLARGGLAELSERIGAVFGEDDTLGFGVFRYLDQLVDLDELGSWVETDDPRLPGWLRPFNGGILVACDEENRYMAGVGLKRHDEFGSEIAVGTEPEFRGRGLARRLVATAARYLLRSGSTATYEHVLGNDASGAVASAAGFRDRGWRAIHLGDEE
ncbi:MAG TPA: GNAT family N-acetyltransferase [Acidimicrobiales bacterium]